MSTPSPYSIVRKTPGVPYSLRSLMRFTTIFQVASASMTASGLCSMTLSSTCAGPCGARVATLPMTKRCCGEPEARSELLLRHADLGAQRLHVHRAWAVNAGLRRAALGVFNGL